MKSLWKSTPALKLARETQSVDKQSWGYIKELYMSLIKKPGIVLLRLSTQNELRVHFKRLSHDFIHDINFDNHLLNTVYEYDIINLFV
jgi:hypothetical protein